MDPARILIIAGPNGVAGRVARRRAAEMLRRRAEARLDQKRDEQVRELLILARCRPQPNADG